MKTEFTIDWLHINEPFKPYSLLGSHIYQHPTKNGNTPHAARYGYTEGVANKAGAHAMRNINRSDMGVLIAYSGSTLNDYRDAGVNVLDILRWHISRGGSASRIDLAFDVREANLSPGYLYDMLVEGKATTTAKAFNLITGNDGGSTVYVGSRTSEAFLRIYDKAAQMQVGGQWTRIELELKSSKARFAAYTMANEPDSKAYQWAQGWLQGYVSFPHPVWREVMTMTSIPLVRANKPETDTRKWLIETCAPAMAKYIQRTDDYAVIIAFMRVLGSGLDIFDLADLTNMTGDVTLASE